MVDRRQHKKKANGPKQTDGSRAKESRKLEDYWYYVGSTRQASDYENTTEFIINHIKKTFKQGNDIAEQMQKMTAVDQSKWEPTLQMSTDPIIATRENKQYEMKYKADYDECIKRKHIYNNNKIKAYALLWERCAKIMQNKISARVDYETKIYDNPIELLKAIREHTMDYQETTYEISIIVDALKAMMTTKPREGENLAEYTHRFKTAKDVLESHIGGALISTKYIKGMDDYIDKDKASFEKCCKEVNAKLFAFLYLENSDQEKYGSIMQNLV